MRWKKRVSTYIYAGRQLIYRKCKKSCAGSGIDFTNRWNTWFVFSSLSSLRWISKICDFIHERSHVLRNFQINFITNTATIRWLKILMAFEKNYQCSTQGLAKISGSTTRTIVTDVTDLKEYFGDCLSIDSSHKGYIFSIKQSAVYLTKKTCAVCRWDFVPYHRKYFPQWSL